LPPWLKVTRQLPDPLVIVMLALPLPEPEHEPVVAIETARLEDAVAATLKLLL
jgi:hypothetical protein